MKKVIITSFEEALKKLKEAYEIYKNPQKYITFNKKSYEAIIHENMRATAIQSFEFTYEEAKKIMERVLEIVFDESKRLETSSFNDLIRLSAEKGLISNPKDWFKAREIRNKTSHTYFASIAEEAILYVPEFIKIAQDLLNNLRKTIGAFNNG
jgi:nucleotidyltransferase substrate binding protein (TIGR01987 family)